MRLRGAFLLAALAASVSGYSAEQPVAIRVAWHEPPAGQDAVVVRARSALDSTKLVEVAVEADQASVVLAPGQWFLSAASPRFWSEPVLLSVADGPTEAVVTLYKAARVRARVTIPAAGKAGAVDVHFNPTETGSRSPRGSTACPVADGHLDCELPAGKYDFSLRVPGHASLYRWDVDLAPDAIVDLGKLAFRRGATLSGHVLVNADAGDALESVKVTLRHATGEDRNEAMRGRQSATRMAATPNRRGFFSFDVLPGRYIVSASSRDLVSDEVPVTVLEGREAILEHPLVLDRLWTLTVNVRIPPEGTKMPWQLALKRFDAEGHPSDERVISVPSDGICRFARQLSGSHTVELRIRDSVWAASTVVLDSDTTIEMPVRVVKVRGSVRLGDNPLQAGLLFVSRENGFRIPARSRADGSFRMFLPERASDIWEEVEIESTEPWVKRLLENVSMSRDDEGVATIDLRLPEGGIEGIVVDDDGQPVGDGLINITAPDGFRQIPTSDGTFTANGLQPGRYALTAATPDGETEGPLFIDLGEDETKSDVVLTVGLVTQLRGSVASASGPVIGASVFIAPSNDAHAVVGAIPVDTTGTFDFRLPPQTRDMLVAVTAPGFSFRMMRVPVPKSNMDVVVDQNGGLLTVDARVGARHEPFRPYLIHNGAVLSGFAAAYLARGRLLGNPDERLQFEIPSAEEGLYSLCLLSTEEERTVRVGARLPESRCASGVLTRHGSLTLRAPEFQAN